ncbi:transposase [Arthrobacter sp.]|uniref:transposase n=1 Tax=Arthrobacter sp. TaxID=1667 RepID=UPI00339235E3
MSVPGVGIKTAATILLTIGDAGTVTSPGHLAAYAGIAPMTRRSGTSIRCHRLCAAAAGQRQASPLGTPGVGRSRVQNHLGGLLCRLLNC